MTLLGLLPYVLGWPHEGRPFSINMAEENELYHRLYTSSRYPQVHLHFFLDMVVSLTQGGDIGADCAVALDTRIPTPSCHVLYSLTT